jgi:hypothetical protein
MLKLLGRFGVEKAKSLAICLLVALLMISLRQVAVDRAEASRADQNRDAAAAVARRFAIALTTYDFAHPYYTLGLQGVDVSSAVDSRVGADVGDVVAAKASSIGDATGVVVATVTDARVEVLVATSQVVSGTYVQAGTRLVGLLDVTVSRSGTAWLVTDYRWLVAPGNQP